LSGVRGFYSYRRKSIGLVVLMALMLVLDGCTAVVTVSRLDRWTLMQAGIGYAQVRGIETVIEPVVLGGGLDSVLFKIRYRRYGVGSLMPDGGGNGEVAVGVSSGRKF